MFCEFMITCFFFKQKTAYEMRISDWSSDVCSSDLRRSDRHEFADLLAVGRLSRPVVLDSDRCCREGRAPAQGPGQGHARLARRGQIGRESCRESVCQYV